MQVAGNLDPHPLDLQGLLQAVLKPGIDQSRDRQEAKQVKPPGLPEGRLDVNVQVLKFFIPKAVGVAGFYLEGVMAGRQIRVTGKPTGTAVDPILVVAFHPVAKAIGLRVAVFQGGKIEGQGVLLILQIQLVELPDVGLQGKGLIVDEALGQLYGRLQVEQMDVLGIKYIQAIVSADPDLSVRGRAVSRGAKPCACKPSALPKRCMFLVERS